MDKKDSDLTIDRFVYAYCDFCSCNSDLECLLITNTSRFVKDLTAVNLYHSSLDKETLIGPCIKPKALLQLQHSFQGVMGKDTECICDDWR